MPIGKRLKNRHQRLGTRRSIINHRRSATGKSLERNKSETLLSGKIHQQIGSRISLSKQFITTDSRQCHYPLGQEPALSLSNANSHNSVTVVEHLGKLGKATEPLSPHPTACHTEQHGARTNAIATAKIALHRAEPHGIHAVRNNAKRIIV